MTISNQIGRAAYAGNGITVAFPVPFKFFTNADLRLIRQSSAGVETLLVLNVDYTLSGAGNEGGGTATLTTAPASGNTLTIILDPPLTQGTDYVSNDAFPAESHERALDRLTQQSIRTRDLVVRTLRQPDGDFDQLDALPGRAARAGLFMAFDAGGDPVPASGTGNDTALRTDLAAGSPSLVDSKAVSHKRTVAEFAALVVPTTPSFVEGVVERYGAVGDGIADDAAAFASAALVAAQGVQLLGTPDKIYKLNSAVTLGSVFRLDLRGSTIKPGNNSGRLTSTAAVATATTTVSAGATQGSRSFDVNSAANLAVGQTSLISAVDFPNFWSKITSIAGTTIEVDRTLPFTYAGAISFAAYASLPEEARIVNGVLDGANVTGSAGNSGQALRLLSFKRVTLDGLRPINYAPAAGANRPIHVGNCIDVFVNGLRATENDVGNADGIWFIEGARKAIVSGCLIDGGGFGFNMELCETAIAIGNTLSGRRTFEAQEAVVPVRSVRGIKFKSCGYVLAQANDISDFETGFKIENYHRFIVVGNTLRNMGLFAYSGQAALAATSFAAPQEPFGIVSSNFIENVGGIAVSVDTSGASTTDANVLVQGNTILKCGRHVVHCGQRKVSVNSNRIEDWNTSNTGAGADSAAVFVIGGGLVAKNNTFENSDATDCCFNVGFVAGQVYDFGGNSRLTGNPEFNGGLQFSEKALTINIGAAATTSAATAHGMVRTPSQSEIDLEVATTGTTNDPGPITVSAVDATNVTVACRNAPGVSTMNVHAKIRIRMPFTA